MNFNDFLIQERAYFSDLSTFAEEIIAQLSEKIKNKKTIRSGDSFIVSLGDMHDIEIKFYKEYSKRAREFAQSQKGVDSEFSDFHALFFPDTTDKADGAIEIYLNNAKPYYYKDVDSIGIVNKRLPKFIKDILRHEITHAYERHVSEFGDSRPNTNAYNDKKFDTYINSDEEINANILALISGEIHDNSLVKYYLSMNDINAAMHIVVKNIKNSPDIVELSDENKKWVLKTAYTTLADYAEKMSITAE